MLGITFWAILAGLLATRKGHSFLKYFLLSYLITPLISIILTLSLINKNKIRKRAISEEKTLLQYVKELLYSKNENSDFLTELFDECDKLSFNPFSLRDYLKGVRKSGKLDNGYTDLIFEHYFPKYIEDMWRREQFGTFENPKLSDNKEAV